WPRSTRAGESDRSGCKRERVGWFHLGTLVDGSPGRRDIRLREDASVRPLCGARFRRHARETACASQLSQFVLRPPFDRAAVVTVVAVDPVGAVDREPRGAGFIKGVWGK